MVKRRFYDLIESGIKDVELRDIKPQWKNSRVGDIAVIQCGRNLLRMRITKVHRGTLAIIFKNVNYKRIFPEASTVFEAVKSTREIYPDAEEFMAFELKDIV